jgi:hypothetical protein
MLCLLDCSIGDCKYASPHRLACGCRAVIFEFFAAKEKEKARKILVGVAFLNFESTVRRAYHSHNPAVKPLKTIDFIPQ